MVRLWIGILLAGLTTASFAGTAKYESADGQVTATVNIPLNPKHPMGGTKGTGALAIGNSKVANLDCLYTTGMTVTLNCSGQGYMLSAVSNLDQVKVTYPSGAEVTLFRK